MQRVTRLLIAVSFVGVCLSAQMARTESANTTYTVASPNGKVRVSLQNTADGPRYAVYFKDRRVVRPSPMGFTFKEADPLKDGFRVHAVKHRTIDRTWTTVLGEQRSIRNHCNELRVTLEEREPPHRRMILRFRAFDDGVGFRYEWPKQAGLDDFQMMDERTGFRLADDHTAWWTPAMWPDRYEYNYEQTRLSETTQRDDVESVHTPLTMRTDDGLYLSIHEAALTDYASMTLRVADDNTLACDLVPWSDGVAVKASAPHHTPWRTIQIAEDPGRLIESRLILNLNEPSKIEDTSWIDAGKYVGIWWSMHLGKHTWWPGEKHGATTERTKRYIDFAADNGFDGVLVEGWNKGWTPDWMGQGEQMDFATPFPGYDLRGLARYARRRGTRLIAHNETAAAIPNYERQLDTIFPLYQELGIRAVKSGYVVPQPGIKRYDGTGNAIGKEWHHGQYMVRHHRKVVKAAAKHQVMMNVHEPIKPTGIRRTWPNMVTREGARGQEYNAWSEGNPPSHTTILPFTRMLAGPMDFTPGIFNLTFDEYRPNHRVRTTRAKQLALYVVIYSPLQMAADLPEHYEGEPAFQFIRDVPADWERTKVLNASIGDYVTIARQQRGRDAWYIGGITDEKPRQLRIELDFLPEGRRYQATVYADAADADWQSNPTAVDITTRRVDSSDTMALDLAASGGCAIELKPLGPSSSRE